ncbi:MAG: nucleotidyltransferase domain-containing protein [Ginsengibacter sp.]
MPENKKHIISLIKKNVSEVDPEADIVLFGSRARGNEAEDSDWDLLILTDYPVSFQVEQQFRHHLFDLELKLGEAFSTFVYSKSDWESKHSVTPLYQNISLEGIRI